LPRIRAISSASAERCTLQFSPVGDDAPHPGPEFGKMNALPEYIDGLPNICGSEPAVDDAIRRGQGRNVFLAESGVDFGRIRSAAAIALHMHQPLIPAGGAELRTAAIISNLKYMMDNPSIGDNHNAPVFHRCYKRMGEFIPDLLHEGRQPRVMLDYSGTLLHGLRNMGLNDVFDNLKRITCEPQYRRAVEWLGSAWGHAVAPSTPVQDYRLHVKAWQHHFAAIFGFEALARVRGFSPAEMALPNHPDVAYEFVRTLRECGYQWVMVQEHSVEQPDGRGPQLKHIPHRLICRNSEGKEAGIVAIVKTQGSDTKLVGQMQPYYEAKGLSRWELGGKSVPPLVTQIADGENGGVMMNDFPPKYSDVVRECSGSDTPLMNVTEYLEHLFAIGVKEDDLPILQPLFQKRVWDRFKPGDGADKLDHVIEQLRKEDSRFHVEGGSWTNNISWVRGYDALLGPMERASSLFYEKVIKLGRSSNEHRYRNALFHLLASQTSCYRYWGQGVWIDYGREICRRTTEILNHDF
jgi:Glycosyl hydrolase family 57